MKSAQWFLRTYLMYFRKFAISPWKMELFVIWTKIRMLCANFCWNWSSGSWVEDEKFEKFTDDKQTDCMMKDDKWLEKLTWALSSDELKIQYLGTKRIYDVGIFLWIMFHKVMMGTKKATEFIWKGKGGGTSFFFYFCKSYFLLLKMWKQYNLQTNKRQTMLT